MIYRMDVKKTLREAANQVVELVTEVWSKARIQFWQTDYIVTKVEKKLHKEFRDVKRHKGRAGESGPKRNERTSSAIG